VLPSGNKTPLPVHLPSKFFGPPFLEKSIKISSFPLNSPSSSHFFVFSPAKHPGVPSSPKTLAAVFDRTSIPLKHPGWFGSEYLPLKTEEEEEEEEEEDSVVIVAPDKTSAFIANAGVVVVVTSKRTVAAAFATADEDDDDDEENLLLEQKTEPFFFAASRLLLRDDDFFESRAEGKKLCVDDDDAKFVAPMFLRFLPLFSPFCKINLTDIFRVSTKSASKRARGSEVRGLICKKKEILNARSLFIDKKKRRDALSSLQTTLFPASLSISHRARAER
jgi:hypothetical protein